MGKATKDPNLLGTIGLIALLMSIIIGFGVFGCKKKEPENESEKHIPMSEADWEKHIPRSEIEDFKRSSKFYTSGLNAAIIAGDQEKVRKLLAGDKMLIRENGFGGDSALILAVKQEDLSMVQLLLSINSSLAKSDSDEWDMTPLHWAVKTSNEEIAKVLVDNHAPINEENIFGRTPLALAQEIGNKVMIEFLKSKGATEQDFEAMTIEAAQRGDHAALKRLLDKGMDVNTRVPNGCCLIHFAAESGNTDVVKLLLDRGANVNDVAPGSRLTPLHEAASNGHIDMVKFLISKGADRKLKHDTGQTPAEMARKWDHPEIADYLDSLDASKQ